MNANVLHLTIPGRPERRPMSSITTHPDQASRRLLISSQMDSLLLLVICGTNRESAPPLTPHHACRMAERKPARNLAVAVRVSGLLSEPVDGVKVLVRAHVRERLVQEVHQGSSSVHLLCGRGSADTWPGGKDTIIRLRIVMKLFAGGRFSSK